MEFEKLMSEFENKAYDKGYRIVKANKPKPKNKFYESEETNNAFIGFLFAKDCNR